MFIKVDNQGYTRDGQQFCHGYFLVLMSPQSQDPDTPEDWKGVSGIHKAGQNTMRAAVVYTKMGQFGQFMMGHARLAGKKLILSGAYGGDGLTCDVPYAAYQSGVPVPQDLYEAWSHGGGWNSVGNERDAMRKFGLELYRAKRAKSR